MHIRQNVSLQDYSTMRLGGNARYMCEVKHKEDIPNALDWAKAKKLPTIMIGAGSNIVWRDTGFKGLVILNKIPGYKETWEDHETCYLTIGAGENWDSAVEQSVKSDLHGIEALSLIPGTAGATPIQNVGAYGQDIAQTLVSIEAYDSKLKKFVTIPSEYCEFGYRTSRFKTTDRGRFFICSITLRLTKENPRPPFYATLQNYLDHLKIIEFTPQIIREVVIAIRGSKLPDPAYVANNGSFFANPIVSKAKFTSLKKKYDNIIGWPADNKIKIPAAWLIETAGYKNFHDQKTGMATWPTQVLV